MVDGILLRGCNQVWIWSPLVELIDVPSTHTVGTSLSLLIEFGYRSIVIDSMTCLALPLYIRCSFIDVGNLVGIEGKLTLYEILEVLADITAMSENKFVTAALNLTIWILCHRHTENSLRNGWTGYQDVRTPLLEDIEATIEFAVPEVPVNTEVYHLGDFPLTVGITGLALSITINIGCIVTETVTGSCTIDTLIWVTACTCGWLTCLTIRSTEFEKIDKAKFLHPGFFWEYPSCWCTPEGSPTVVWWEVITSHTREIDWSDILVGIVVCSLEIVCQISVWRCTLLGRIIRTCFLITVVTGKGTGIYIVLTETVLVTYTTKQIQVVVVTTLISWWVAQSCLGCIFGILELADIGNRQVIIVVVPWIHVSSLCWLESLVCIEADCTEQAQSLQYRTQIVLGIQGRIQVTTTVLLQTGTTQVTYRVVGGRWRVDTSDSRNTTISK